MAWILFRYCVCAQLPSLQIEIHRYYLAVCSAELEPQQQSTDQKLSLKRSCVACHLHQTGSSHVVDSQSNKWHAQIELFPLYGWKACIRWQLDDLPNATQWFILQDWVEIHEFPMQQAQDWTLAFTGFDSKFVTISFIWSRRIHGQLVSADDLSIVSCRLALIRLRLSGLKSWLHWGQEKFYYWHEWVMINEAKTLPIACTRSLVYSTKYSLTYTVLPLQQTSDEPLAETIVNLGQNLHRASFCLPSSPINSTDILGRALSRHKEASRGVGGSVGCG